MADEAQVRASLYIRVGELNYQSQPTAFNADVSVGKGPTPGYLLATTTGVDVDLSKLNRPGLCRIMNLDDTNFVTVGIRDPDSSLFYPLMELLPGESYVIRLSRDVGEEYTGPGTGTGTGTPNNTLRVRADTDSCGVLVEAFET